jgi:hypothetical protein
MTDDLPAPVPPSLEAPAPHAPEPGAAAPVTPAELTDLRHRADKYRFLFRTIIAVTGILVAATLIVVLAALLIDN